jgi:dCMP deaminase
MSKKFDDYFMKIAEETAKLSYCERKKVGAVLVKNNRTIANGLNGTIAGTENCCESKEYMNPDIGGWFDVDSIEEQYPHKDEKGRYKLVTNDLTMHAEQNIITYCAKNGIPMDDTTIYITLSPCKTCAKLMASSGIKRVVYGEQYRDTEGVDFLKSLGIEVVHYNEKTEEDELYELWSKYWDNVVMKLWRPENQNIYRLTYKTKYTYGWTRFNAPQVYDLESLKQNLFEHLVSGDSVFDCGIVDIRLKSYTDNTPDQYQWSKELEKIDKLKREEKRI